MASLGRLLVSLNLDTKPFERSIKAAERSVRKTARSMDRFGKNLTTNLTLPILAAGGAALKAFGEMDSLRRGLATLEPTTDSLNKRLKELKEVAQLPGLGLKEAIQADIRLRSVGVSADLAKDAMLQFGNAIALAGGGKAELDRVTTQLGQLSAKGKVMAEDLQPIIEIAPSAASALRKLYGTVSSQDISKILEKQGKDSTEFIRILVDELSKAPRVEGGFKNALENIGDSLLLFGDRIGESINNVFDLEGAAKAFSERLDKITEAFSKLNPATQKFIILSIGITAALGPAVIVMGKLVSVFGGAYIKVIVLARAISNISKVAAIASIKIALITAAVALVALGITYVVQNWEALKERVTDVTFWKNAMINIAQVIIKFFNVSFKKVLSLYNFVIEKFGGEPVPNIFETAVDGLEKLKDKTKVYANELMTIAEFEKNLGNNLKKLAKDIFFDPNFSAPDALKTGGILGGGDGSPTQLSGEDVPLSSFEKATIKANNLITLTRSNLSAAINLYGQFKTSVLDTGDRVIEKLTGIGTALVEAPTSLSQTGELLTFDETRAETFAQGMKAYGDSFEKAGEAINQFQETQNEAIKNSEIFQETLASGIEAVGAGIAGFVDSGLSSFKSLADGIRSAVQQIIGYLAKLVVAQVAGKTIGTLGPLGLAVAGALAAVANSVFNSIVGGTKVPELAQGGIVPDGYPDDSYLARLTSGEVIIPPKRLNEFLLPNGQRNEPIALYGQLQGTDIYLANERTAAKLGRRR